jgi:predicted PolB exonuclease-like 3'-5' exonuclease
MIFALDIETIPNAAMVPFLPEPEISAVLKDPAKIAAARAEAKLEQVSKMALDPMTGRVCACALVGVDGADDFSSVAVATGTDDECELALLAMIFTALGRKDARIVTFNGMFFDIPYLYKRAMILGLPLGEYGTPPLSAWTKRYSTDRHCDIARVWYGWGPAKKGENLDLVASMVLKESKMEIDVTTFPELMTTEEGRNKIGEYCLKDTELTWRLWKKMEGYLFV